MAKFHFEVLTENRMQEAEKTKNKDNYLHNEVV